MKHLIHHVLLSILFLSVCSPAFSATEVRINGIYYSLSSNSSEGNVAHVIYGTYQNNYTTERIYYQGDIVIPQSVTYEGVDWKVTEIASSAFADCKDLTSIKLPSSLRIIRRKAFYNCTGLSEIVLPEEVTSSGNVGEDAFTGCTNLKSPVYNSSFFAYMPPALVNGEYTIPQTKVVGDKAFANCTGITKLIIPSSIENIASNAFFGCWNLSDVHIDSEAFLSQSRSSTITFGFFPSEGLKITLGETISCIGDYFFRGCQNLVSVDLANVETIGTGAFTDCSSLSEITIPESVVSIGSGVFRGCTSLAKPLYNSHFFVFCPAMIEGEYSIPDGISTIMTNAFESCVSITGVEIPQSVDTIGAAAFLGCVGLSEITLPQKLAYIDENAFYGCKSLASITFLCESVTTKRYAFYGCTKLEKVIVPNLKGFFDSVFDSDFGSPLYFAQHIYSNKDTEITELIVPDGVSVIRKNLFSGCTNITSVVLSPTVQTIEEKAFYNCRMKSVSIPSSIARIESKAFDSNPLETVFIEDLDAWCRISFQDEYSNPMRYLNYFNNGKVISNGKELEEVIFPRNLEYVKPFTFINCKSLHSVSIPEGVIEIQDAAFEDCKALETVLLPSTLKKIGNRAFQNCGDLSDEDYPNWILYGLRNIQLPVNLERIGEKAFYRCEILEKLVFPDNIYYIGEKAFDGYRPSVDILEPLHLYANRGSQTLLSLWRAGYEPMEIGKQDTLKIPTLVLEETTQASARFKIENYTDEYEYSNNCLKYNVIWDYDAFTVTGLRPNDNGDVRLFVAKSGNGQEETPVYMSPAVAYATLPLSPNIEIRSTASSLLVEGTHIHGDARILSETLTVDGEKMDGNICHITGLDPESEFGTASYSIVVGYGNDLTYTYKTDTTNFSSAPLTLTTLQPRVVSSGNVVVAADSNLDDAEINVGFEWRRTDWTDDFKSNTGGAYLFDGMMEGYIRNLNADKLWKVRPYYTSNSGKSYYGEWVGLDPSNTSYFEPTVHTYAYISIEGNSAQVKGYVMRGSDNVTQQGFKYWKASPNPSNGKAKNAPKIPSDAKTVEAEGNVMTAELTGLDYDSEYCVVAFVKTSENETFYGEQQTFQTGIDTNGVEDVTAQPGKAEEVARYDIKGRRIDAPWKGLNIIRMSDGTVRKVMVK